VLTDHAKHSARVSLYHTCFLHFSASLEIIIVTFAVENLFILDALVSAVAKQILDAIVSVVCA